MDKSKLRWLLDDYIASAKKFYPELEFGSSFSMYSGEEPKSFEFQFGFEAKNLFKTDYHFTGSKIIHYTSDIRTAVEIIKSGFLRLSNLISVNDPQEINFTNSYLGLKFSDEQINDFKSSYFSASFCQVLDDNQPDNFSMWRHYGNDGLGAALIFEIVNNGSNWDNYLFGNVLYGICDAVKKYREYSIWHEEFQKKYNSPIKNYPNAINALMGLHKNQIWESENEVRLLTYRPFDKYILKEKHPLLSELHHSVTKQGKIFSFIELPLFESVPYKELQKKINSYGFPDFLKEKLPALKLSQIILGYRNSTEAYFNIEKVIGHYSKNYLHPIFLTESHISKFM